MRTTKSVVPTTASATGNDQINTVSCPDGRAMASFPKFNRIQRITLSAL
jgi:hypothetical protein